MQVADIIMKDDPASSKNGSASLSMRTMYIDMNREAASISPMHHRRYAVLGISLYFAIRYSHPLVIDIDTRTMQNNIVALNAKDACSM